MKKDIIKTEMIIEITTKIEMTEVIMKEIFKKEIEMIIETTKIRKYQI